MSVRNDASNWYEAKYGKIEKPIYTSKFYKPEESWPKKSVWWPQFPISTIAKFSYTNLICQVAPAKNDFYHLKVPTKFLKEHLKKFHTIKELISLYLSTNPKELFIEIRGAGNLDFSKFLVS
jgi:hypothetical protein